MSGKSVRHISPCVLLLNEWQKSCELPAMISNSSATNPIPMNLNLFADRRIDLNWICKSTIMSINTQYPHDGSNSSGFAMKNKLKHAKIITMLNVLRCIEILLFTKSLFKNKC